MEYERKFVFLPASHTVKNELPFVLQNAVRVIPNPSISQYPSQPTNTMNNRLEQLMEFYRDDPKDAFTRYGIALEYNSRKDFPNAVEWFELLRRDEPDYVPTYYMLAGVYRALGNIAKAEEIYRAGQQAAKRTGDNHAFSELSAALEELEDED
jgi:tetratricopeptide (TPR) repeat protein